MKNIFNIWLVVVLFVGASAPVVQAQSPTLDPSFAVTSAVQTQGNGAVSMADMVLQPDGKLVVAGDFSSLNGHPAPGLARLLPDGQVDPSFAAAPTSNVTVPALNIIRSIALQADGKLLVGGHFTAVGGQPRFGLARLLPDGSLDTAFVPPYGGGPPRMPTHL